MQQVRSLIILLAISCAAGVANGQSKRAWHWYFGWESGLDFSTGACTPDISGKLKSIEGSSSISDINGNLLFYTNGESIRNKNHQIMPNGIITGDQSATQSALVVPLPESTDSFYLFTSVGGSLDNGARYSIVDMKLSGGLGDVTASKNILLHTSATEALAGTLHCNAKDYWILMRESVSGLLKFHAYLLTKNGITNHTVTSFIEPNLLSNVVDGLSFSTDGELLAYSSLQSDIIIYTFNKQTGTLTLNKRIPATPNQQFYSTAFSTNKNHLYVTSWTTGAYCHISQYSLSTSPSSRKDLDSLNYSSGSPNGFGFFGAVRLAPDQKIYISRWHQDRPFQVNPSTYYSLDSISRIAFPNLEGAACGYQRNALYLNHKPTMLGLPNFVSNFNSPVNSVNNCGNITPVKLKFFTARKQNANVALQWQTENEQDILNYELEWKSVFGAFVPIGLVNVQNNPITSTYDFIHTNPQYGKNFYRLKINERSGASEYSQIRVVEFISEVNFTVTPNPAGNSILFTGATGMDQTVSFNIFDKQGKKVAGESRFVQRGIISEKINLERFSAGYYILLYTSRDGYYTFRFLKN